MKIPAQKVLVALACALVLTMPCIAFAASGAEKAPADSTIEKPGPSDELMAWADGKDCGSCHEAQAASAEDKDLGAGMHAAMKLGCIDCHADDALVEIHDKAKPDAKVPTKLKKSQLDLAKCATCHVPDKLAEKTAECTALTDSEDNVVNPHDIPDVKDHKKILCQSCHNMHSESKASSKAPSLCQDCHHEDVYECYTCHS